jgi:hypothetical protein
MLLQQRLIEFKEHQRTPAEEAYLKLQARREVMSDQLEELVERRDDLANDIARRSGADREGIEARMRALDTQIQAAEADLAAVTKEVANAATPSVADHVHTVYRGFSDDDMVGAGFAGAGIMFALFIPLIWRTFRRRRHVPPGTNTTGATPAIGSERIERMEMAIDSIAVEMERVSENQRFMTRLMTETQLAGTIAAVRGSTEAARMAAEKSNG